MKLRHLLTCIFISAAALCSAQDQLSALIPMPNEITTNPKASLQFTAGKSRYYAEGNSLDFAKDKLNRIFQKRMGISLLPANRPGQAEILLRTDSTLQNREQYRLEATSRKLTITGATPEAVLYGIQTLDQLMLGDVCATAQNRITAISINDAPRFGYRAIMLDPARHFLPIEDIKFFIDQMVKYKFNVLQLHLTDDQGWRIHIKSHPHLASKEHYTHEEIRDLIAYASQHNIEIIPEVDIPGHTVAILAAYPELACGHQHDTVIKVGKTTNRMLCASNKQVYKVLEDVISEISSLFSSPKIHLGGDEAAVPENWEKCPDCNRMMKKYGYTRATELMIPFFNQVLDKVRKNGKQPILWCELNNIYPPADDYLFPYPSDVTLVSWRNGLTPACLDLTYQHDNPLILAPGEYAYLDYPQYQGDLPEFNNWGMPVTTLEQTYQFDPGYNRPPEQQQHILGVMCTLWGEAIPDINRLNYMAFPRAFAISEAGWTLLENRQWESFKQRIYPNLTDLMKCGVSVRAPFEIAPKEQP